MTPPNTSTRIDRPSSFIQSKGADQTSGLVKLSSGDVLSSSQRTSCLLSCMQWGLTNSRKVTGCQAIWGQSNRGCYGEFLLSNNTFTPCNCFAFVVTYLRRVCFAVHTAEVTQANKKVRQKCWIFSKCKYPGEPVKGIENSNKQPGSVCSCASGYYLSGTGTCESLFALMSP